MNENRNKDGAWLTTVAMLPLAPIVAKNTCIMIAASPSPAPTNGPNSPGAAVAMATETSVMIGIESPGNPVAAAAPVPMAQMTADNATAVALSRTGIAFPDDVLVPSPPSGNATPGACTPASCDSSSEGSAGMFRASQYSVEKYRAHIVLSAASPAI
mmetsp:Transcript_4280/g.12067  ORF Transcript_4280/g.12067 Transcript_4280/m.12067 type:complete len:157 (-) Transcript_4280:1302-1772(-)